MSYSGPITIHHRDGWKLDSYGNGAAYTLTHELPDGKTESCFFQGDDASTFRDDFERYENPVLMFQDYSEVMQPDD
jgi:hypothetical protein